MRADLPVFPFRLADLAIVLYITYGTFPWPRTVLLCNETSMMAGSAAIVPTGRYPRFLSAVLK
jgi:hypothetical protein